MYFDNEEEYKEMVKDEYELLKANQRYIKIHDSEKNNLEIQKVRKEVEEYIERRNIVNFGKLYKKFSNKFGEYQFYELILSYLENKLIIEEIMPTEFTNLSDALIRKRGIEIW